MKLIKLMNALNVIKLIILKAFEFAISLIPISLVGFATDYNMTLCQAVDIYRKCPQNRFINS